MKKKRWIIVFILFLASVNNYMDRQTLSVLAPHLRDALNLSNVDYSFIVNAFLISYALMYSGSGYLMDLLGGRRGVALCMLGWSIATALHAAASGFLSLVFYRFLLGLSEPGLFPGALKIISRIFPARDRGIAFGLVISGNSIGAIIAPPVVVWLLLQFGWRVAFLATALSGFFVLIAWRIIYREKDDEFISQNMEKDPSDLIKEDYRWRDLLKIRTSWALIAIRILGDPVWYFILFWLPNYIVKERGFSMELLGKTAWIPYIGVDLGIILGGLAAKAMIQRGGQVLRSRKAVALLSAVLVPFGFIGSLYVEGPYLIMSIFAVAVFAMGLWMSTVHTLPGDLFPFGNVASIYGLCGTAGAFGGIGFIALAGVLADAGLSMVSFWLASLMFPLSVLILVIFIKPAVTDRE